MIYQNQYLAPWQMALWILLEIALIVGTLFLGGWLASTATPMTSYVGVGLFVLGVLWALWVAGCLAFALFFWIVRATGRAWRGE